MKLDLLTISRLRSYRSCPRLHHYKYDLHMRPVRDAPSARFGSIFHAGLEGWWLACGRGDANRLKPALTSAWDTWYGPGDDDTQCVYELVRAEELLRGYDARWYHAKFEALGVEVEFRMPLINPDSSRPSRTYELGGKMDCLVRNRALDAWLMEHKTSSEDLTPGSEYWKRLRIDGQVSLYLDAARHLGHDVVGCLYDVAKRPTLKPRRTTPEDKRKYKKDGTLYKNQRLEDESADEYRERVRDHIAANPDTYYQRGTVVRLESEMHEARWDVWHQARMIREAELADRHVRNPGACVQYGRTCEYFDVCSGSASLDDESKFRKSAKHPELSQEAQSSDSKTAE